jgi:regulator of replication initiation timing
MNLPDDEYLKLTSTVLALANDVQRMHLLLRELAAEGVLPPLPWDLVQAQLDLQYQAHALSDTEAEPTADRMAELEKGRQTVDRLRRDFASVCRAHWDLQRTREP